MKKKILSVILSGLVLLGVMPLSFAAAAEPPEPVLSAGFDDETLGGGTVGSEEYGVEYGEGVNGKALYIGNRTESGGHLYGEPAQNYAEFSLPSGTLTTGDYTVSVWYRSTLSEFVEGTLLSNTVSSTNGLNFYVSGNQYLQAKIGDEAKAYPMLNWETTPMSAVIADREWHHLAFSVNRSEQRVVIYIDGAEYAVRTLPVATDTEIGSDTLTVGARGFEKTYGLDAAFVDELAVYGTALSGEEVAAVYDETALPMLADAYSASIDNISADGVFYTETVVGYLKDGIASLKEMMSDDSLSLAEKQTAMAEFKAFYNSVMYADAEADFAFAATSDTHTEEVSYVTRFENFLKDVKTAKPNSRTVIVAGDLTNNGAQAEFNKYFNTIKQYAPAGMPVLSAMGNHDVRGPLSNGSYSSLGDNFNTTTLQYYLNGVSDTAGLESGYDKPYYHKVVSGYHFFVLNTETGLKDNSYISDSQLLWLYEELEKIKADDADGIIDKPIFVTLHQPLPYTFAGTEADITDEAANETVTNEIIDAAMNTLKTLLSGYPVVYFSGHRHDAASTASVMQNGDNIYVNMPAATVNHASGEGCNDSTMLSYYVSVHGQSVRFRVRNFNTGMWLPEYEAVYKLDSLDPEPETSEEETKPEDAIWLNTIYGFEEGQSFTITDDSGAPVSGGSAQVVGNIGAVGGGNALSVGASGREWTYDYLSFPMSVSRSDANGLLIYVKWGTNQNMFFALTGTDAEGGIKTVTPPHWTSNLPMYDVVNNVWKGSQSSTENPTVPVGGGFEGYVYIPFDRIDTGGSIEEFTDVTLGGYGNCGNFAIGGIWAVENSVIPETFSGQDITNAVWLNGSEDTLEKETSLSDITDKIALTPLTDFSDYETYTAHNENGSVPGTVFATAANRGAVGGGNALEIDFSANSYWQDVYANIPLDAEKGEAAGMLIYVETWSNTNLRLKVLGKNSAGEEVTAALSKWSAVPVYDAYAGGWRNSEASPHAANVVLPHYYFEGYVYIPFSRLDNQLETITGIEIGSYRNDASKYMLTVGGIYLVENGVLPGNYTDGMMTDVLINETETTLSNIRLGDFDGDGAVNAIDLSALKEQLLGMRTESYTDVKKDGVLDLMDLIRLKKILSS